MIKELFAVGDTNWSVFELIRESLQVLEQGKGVSGDIRHFSNPFA